MDDERLHLAVWDRLTSAERAAGAREVAERLPAPWRLLGLEWHALGDQRHEVAFFDWHGARFALIPGGDVTLGYDRDHPFVPNTAQLESWYGEEWEAGSVAVLHTSEGESYAAYSGKAVRDEEIKPLEEYLDYCMTPLRQVFIKPLLVEVTTSSLGLNPSSEYPGWWEVWAVSHADAVAAATEDGFRLLTSNEWEHTCAAGSRTLWRWGVDCPMNCLPAGTLDAYQSTWDMHRRPNAFGLLIGNDPYDWEFCAEPDIMRGGDGGIAICGGEGILASWLTLATAFVENRYRELLEEMDDADYTEDPLYVASSANSHSILRRAYTIP